MTIDSPSFVKFCSISGCPNVLTRCVVTYRPACSCFFFFHVSLTTRSTVEFFRIRTASGSTLSMLRTSDHSITNSNTSKTMTSAAPIVAARFEIHDISAILPMAVRARIRFVRARFLALLSKRRSPMYHDEIDSLIDRVGRVVASIDHPERVIEKQGREKEKSKKQEERERKRERTRIICLRRMNISKRASPSYLRIYP